jgi:hypothetical protein
MDAAERLGAAADGSLTKAQLAAELSVRESELPGCVVGSVALREVVQLCGYSRRRAQQLVMTTLNGTIQISPHSLRWAPLDALTVALDNRPRRHHVLRGVMRQNRILGDTSAV